MSGRANGLLLKHSSRGAEWLAGYAALVTFLSLVAGLLGSVYSSDIKNAFPLYLGRAPGGFGPISLHALLFWIAAILAALLFFFLQFSSELSRKASEQKLIEQSTILANVLRTLPPPEFLREFSEIYRRCNAALAEVLKEPESSLKRESVEYAIRLVLIGVATLAQNFDGAEPGEIYGANIMCFQSLVESDAFEVSRIRSHLKFVEPELDLKALRGVLELDLSLSTTTDGDAAEPDPGLKELALPIPKVTKGAEQKWRVLPGAPMAFLRKQLRRICRHGDPGRVVSEKGRLFAKCR